MTDDMQRAREQFKEWAESSGKTVHGFNRIEDMWDAWQAATSALRAAPEGFAVSPEDPSPSMIRAGLLFGLSPNQACAVYQSMLAARPQGVKR